jgi:type VI secretion system secreted protein VgrG
MASPTQLHRTIAVGTPLGDDVLLMRSFTFTERLGRPFEMVLDMLSTQSNLDFSQIVGQNVTVRIQKPKDNEPRYFNGIVRQFSQVGASGRLTNYKAVVVPWLWLLTRTSDCRIFQEMTVPDIIKKVFKDHGLTDIDDKISGSHRTWEYCVQYRETDFNFVSRLMEQEGIYYYFTHENGKHKMVLADSKSAHEPFGGYEEIIYRPPTSEFRQKEVLTELAVSQEVQPGTYAHTDFDFKAPAKNLQAKSQVQRQHAAADFEIYDYPGEYDQTGDGENYAKSRIEELQSGFEVVHGSGDVRGVATGCKFTLQDHPTASFNRDYLIVETSIEASTDEYDSAAPGTVRKGVSFKSSIVAIDCNTQFRAARTTPLPLIRGPQTAIVVGPSGEEIYTDKYGRVKVQFHWDRYSKADQNSSCWIRVSQDWAGKKWGAMFIPRIGQEVIVEFLEGDPDRPIITGRVYNDKAMPPYDLPGNMTRSTIKTNSSKGGGGWNEIRIEDKKDSEQIFIHAQKNMDERVKNDSKEFIGNDRHLIVKKKQYEKVEEEKHLIVTQDHVEKIGGDMHLHVVGNENEKSDQTISRQAGMNIQEKCGQNYAMEAGTAVHIKAGMTCVIEAGMQLTLKVGGNFVTIDPVGVSISGTLVNINSGGAAGSGAGSSPEAPKDPTEAKEADDDNAGSVDQPPPKPQPPTPVTYSAQATVLQKAAEDGTPFCAVCEAARRARQNQQGQ